MSGRRRERVEAARCDWPQQQAQQQQRDAEREAFREAVRRSGPAAHARGVRAAAVVVVLVVGAAPGCSAPGGPPVVEPMPRGTTAAGPVVVDSQEALTARMLAICEPDLRAQLRDAAAAVIEPGALEWSWWDDDGYGDVRPFGVWNLGGTLEGPVSGERAWSCYVFDERFPPSDPARWDEDAQASVLARVYP